MIGKTNLADQFATGKRLRARPYGTPRNAYNEKLIPGGSSSGSAVAVAAGLVPLALGTDTAGSSRVPAALNNIVGLKPSLGMVSTAGIVRPAARWIASLFDTDRRRCVRGVTGDGGRGSCRSVFAVRPTGSIGPVPHGLRIAVPKRGQRIFAGDEASAGAYDAALDQLGVYGANVTEIDIETVL